MRWSKDAVLACRLDAAFASLPRSLASVSSHQAEKRLWRVEGAGGFVERRPCELGWWLTSYKEVFCGHLERPLVETMSVQEGRCRSSREELWSKWNKPWWAGPTTRPWKPEMPPQPGLALAKLPESSSIRFLTGHVRVCFFLLFLDSSWQENGPDWCSFLTEWFSCLGAGPRKQSEQASHRRSRRYWTTWIITICEWPGLLLPAISKRGKKYIERMEV